MLVLCEGFPWWVVARPVDQCYFRHEIEKARLSASLPVILSYFPPDSQWDATGRATVLSGAMDSGTNNTARERSANADATSLETSLLSGGRDDVRVEDILPEPPSNNEVGLQEDIFSESIWETTRTSWLEDSGLPQSGGDHAAGTVPPHLALCRTSGRNGETGDEKCPNRFKATRIDKATGETKEVYIDCGKKSCEVCSERLRDRYIAHYVRRFQQLREEGLGIFFLTLSVDRKVEINGVPLQQCDPSETRKYLSYVWGEKYRNRLYRRTEELKYLASFEQGSNPRHWHLHVVMGLEAEEELDRKQTYQMLRSQWFESGGGAEADVKELGVGHGGIDSDDRPETLPGAIGYVVKYAFQDALDRPGSRSIMSSQGLGYHSEKAKKERTVYREARSMVNEMIRDGEIDVEPDSDEYEECIEQAAEVVEKRDAEKEEEVEWELPFDRANTELSAEEEGGEESDDRFRDADVSGRTETITAKYRDDPEFPGQDVVWKRHYYRDGTVAWEVWDTYPDAEEPEPELLDVGPDRETWERVRDGAQSVESNT